MAELLENMPSVNPKETTLSLSPIENAKEELEVQAKINKSYRDALRPRKTYEVTTFVPEEIKPSALEVRPHSPPKITTYKPKLSDKYANEIAKKYNHQAKVRSRSPTDHPDYMRPTASIALKATKEKTISDAARKLLQADQEKREKEYPFRPQLLPNPYEEKVEANREDRIELLAQPMIGEIYKRERLKEEAMKEEMEKECTFKPTLVAKKGLNETLRSEEVEERLFREAKRRADNIEKARKEKESKELEGCTFKPKIIDNEKEINAKPIYERFQDIQKKRSEKLQKLREKVEGTNPDLKFHPKINKTKQSPSPDARTVTERLCKDAVERTEKLYRKSELASQLASQQHPFAPSIIRGKVSEEDFFARQTALQERRREHEVKGLDDPRCTFHPAVNFTSEMLLSADPKRMRESTQERIKRLAKRDQKREELLKQEVEQENREKYTYHPEINERSKMMISLKSPKAIDAEEVNRRKEEKKREAENRKMGQCTFHPQIKSVPHIKSHYTDPNNILSAIKEKEKEKETRITQYKQIEEYDKTKECTFKPQVEKPSILKELTTIAGLDRHLELQERKKKLEQEKRQRENEVFDHSKKYDQRRTSGKPHYTIPTPFALSENKENFSRATKETLEKEKAECRFRPETLEAAKKKKVQKILEQKTMEAATAAIQ